MAEDKQSGDPFEAFRALWGPLGVPAPGMAMPTLDPQLVEKRIGELRSIEGWLSMNLGMVRMSIQGLEMQRAALLAMRATQGEGEPKKPGAAGAGGAPDVAAAMLWPWAFVQQALAGAGTAAAGAAKPSDASAEGGAPGGAPGPEARDEPGRKPR